MKKIIILLLFPFVFGQCETPPSVNLVDRIDPDIVLINIEEGDRAFIGNLLLKINSFKPKLIAVDAMFEKEKDPKKDSILMNAFKSIQNDILLYWLDKNDKPLYPAKIFSDYVSGMGVAEFGYNDDLVDRLSPILRIDNKIHETFPLVVTKLWKPSLKYDFKSNRSIQINYTRSLEQFAHINGSDLNNNIDSQFLKNKIVLVGFLGPGDEDKFFTPIRLVKKYFENQPDTYGLVINANAIRTILEQGKEK